MHILVTNDDGPPSPTSSPYVHSLVKELQKAGHTVSVCLPHTQRSWIGKAHMIGQTVKPTYYRPSQTFDPSPLAQNSTQGSTHTRPSQDGEEEWILVDGTPASAAQIGLHHFFQDRGPVDLVVSGPNYGRNTTAVFALSSGTLGGALEAAVCKRKSIALSYAFSSRNHDPVIIDAASRHSVRVIEALYKQWPTDASVDLYSVNVPLEEGVEDRKTLYTNMLQNCWGDGGACFEEVEGSVADEGEEEARIRETGEKQQQQAGSTEASHNHAHRHFKWAPKFTDVYKSVDEAPPGNDGWAVREGLTSVTPLKANFWHAATQLQGEELKLPPTEPSSANLPINESSLAARPKPRPEEQFLALIAYEDDYVQPLILSALKKLFHQDSYSLLSVPAPEGEQSEIDLSRLLSSKESRVLQITPYEAIDWDFVATHPSSCVVNSYMLRKALIRKHYLSATVENWVAKRPDSVLKTHVKRSEAFEVDYAEFLDDALVDAFDLRASLEKNEASDVVGDAKARDWWILKPSMSDRGQGIRIFSTMGELQGIFDEWEQDQPSSDEEDDGDNDGDDQARETSGFITTSHLRHFVAQPYIDPPLLLPGDNRKFHIRTYVSCVGDLDVYVYRHMLALFAAKPYVAPGSSSSSPCPAAEDLESHLTNTCLQRSVAEGTVQRFWDLPRIPIEGETGNLDDAKTAIFSQICAVTGELFEAAARGMMMHFRPLSNAFELYGLDFLVDTHGHSWLLEVNAFPDFRQTGGDLSEVVAGLWEAVLSRVGEMPTTPEGSNSILGVQMGDRKRGPSNEDDGLIHVKRVELGNIATPTPS